ncbi:hypothetical protein GCM10027059_26240 [Myceligenerans halotolerans]
MEWWEGFWGWLIPAATSVIAAAVVVVQEVRHMREKPRAGLSIKHLGELADEDGPAWKVFQLANTGDAAAHIPAIGVVGAEPGFPDGEHEKFLIPQALPPWSEHVFAVEHGDTSRAWAWIVTRSHRRPGRMVARWLPLDERGPLMEDLLRQVDEARSPRARLSRWLRRKRLPASPAGVPVVRLPRGRRLSEEEEGLVPDGLRTLRP